MAAGTPGRSLNRSTGGVPDQIAVGAHGLLLRRWRIEDAPRLLAAIESSLSELRLFMPWAMETPTLETVEAFLGSLTPGQSMGFGLFEDDGDGELVGGSGLHDRRGPGILEIGYWVRSDRTGRGYATATARALTQVALDSFPLAHRIEIRCDPANGASRAIPLKLGYVLDRTEDVAVEAGGQTGRQEVWVHFRS
ncbi:MAG TPA: GNAT family N-acetyltransferase [Acidimicrobiales bacterium]|nr:GNAT family N-acetyltransferase [Acidimicrobiales bacterium]